MNKKYIRLIAFACEMAKGVAFDGCHKIFVLMDAEALDHVYAQGYGQAEGSKLVTGAVKPHEYASQVRTWYRESCPLRLVQAIRIDEGQVVFTDIVPQGG